MLGAPEEVDTALHWLYQGEHWSQLLARHSQLVSKVDVLAIRHLVIGETGECEIRA